MNINCSCLLFEFRGIVCRHSLLVFAQGGLLKLQISIYYLGGAKMRAGNTRTLEHHMVQKSKSHILNDMMDYVRGFYEIA